MSILPNTQGPQRLGPYAVQKRLGQGGMGAVYVGRREDTGAVHALKVMNRVADERGRTRFAREANALLRVRHPNVVAIHESGLAGEQPWFAMELLEGEALSALLTKGRLPLDTALEL